MDGKPGKTKDNGTVLGGKFFLLQDFMMVAEKNERMVMIELSSWAVISMDLIFSCFPLFNYFRMY